MSLLFWRKLRAEHFAVETRDVGDGDFFGAGGFARIRVRAGAESFRIHLSDHVLDASFSFNLPLRKKGKLRNFG